MPEPAKRAATWTRVAFGDVVRQVKDRVDPEQCGLERYVAGEHMETDDLRLRRWGEIGDGYLGPAFHMRFKPGHVLYGSRRTYLRKVAVADFEGITANTTYVLESKDPKVLLPVLLPFIMQTEAFNQHSVRESKGSVNPYVNFSDLAWYQFDLPPIKEQEQIAQLLQGIELCLSTALDARNIAYSALRSLLLSKVPRVSVGQEGWPVARFGDHVEIIDPNPSHRYPDYDGNGVPLIATQDFFGRDDYVFDKCKRVPRDVFEKQRGRCRFEADDVVFARKGILGSARRYGSEEKAFSHTIVVMKPRGESMASNFLLWVARSDSFMYQIQRKMNSNSGVPTLGVKTLEDLQVYLPPKDEQHTIAMQAKSMDQAAKQWGERHDRYEILMRRALKRLSCAGQTA